MNFKCYLMSTKSEIRGEKAVFKQARSGSGWKATMRRQGYRDKDVSAKETAAGCLHSKKFRGRDKVTRRLHWAEISFFTIWSPNTPNEEFVIVYSLNFNDKLDVIPQGGTNCIQMPIIDMLCLPWKHISHSIFCCCFADMFSSSLEPNDRAEDGIGPVVERDPIPVKQCLSYQISMSSGALRYE